MDTGLGAKAYAIIEQGKIGMILSSRPTDRRQLIEEAAGITKYKSRRRAAELKLEAAQQNLTRVDDIVFEVEKQRGALKRQAAKARRYKRLREELRRWEKVLFARRYRELAAQHRIGAGAPRGRARARNGGRRARRGSRSRPRAACASSRPRRIARAASREAAHARSSTSTAGSSSSSSIAIRRARSARARPNRGRDRRDSKRGASRRASPSRRAAQACADAERRARRAAAALLAEAEAHARRAQQRIEALEADVERRAAQCTRCSIRSTTLRHAMEHAAAQRDRVGETLGKLDVEESTSCVEVQKLEADRDAAADGAEPRARGARLVRIAASGAGIGAGRRPHRTRGERARASARASRIWPALEARLASLEELVATRGEFGDAARMVLVQANGHVGQQGAVADYLEVDSRTSAPSKRASATSSSTSSSNATIRRPPAFRSFASTMPAAAASS